MSAVFKQPSSKEERLKALQVSLFHLISCKCLSEFLIVGVLEKRQRGVTKQLTYEISTHLSGCHICVGHIGSNIINFKGDIQGHMWTLRCFIILVNLF